MQNQLATTGRVSGVTENFAKTQVRVIFAEPNKRYSVRAAERYGIRVCLSQEVNPFDAQATISHFKSGLEGLFFDPDRDFVCLTGDVLSVALLLSTVLAVYGRCTTLMFDASGSQYKQRRIVTPH